MRRRLAQLRAVARRDTGPGHGSCGAQKTSPRRLEKGALIRERVAVP
jgi:hypothetical protein